MINERKLTKDELAKREDIVQGMKQNKRTLVKKYGKDAEKVMYGHATKKAKTTTENMDSKKASIRKMIEDALMVKEVSPFVLAADAARDAGEKEFEFPKGSGKMHPVTIKQDIKEDKFSNSVMNDLMQDVRNLAHTTGMSEQEAAEIACMEIEREFGLGDMNEDLDLGHQDDEPGMLKGDLYKIGKYAMELYQMMDSFEGQGEVDFPHWWQSKITTAKNMISGAKHYLDFEVKEPQIDAMVDAIAEGDAITKNMSDEELKIFKDITSSLNEGNFSDIIEKVKKYARKGLITLSIISSLMSPALGLSQSQQSQIQNIAQTEMSIQDVSRGDKISAVTTAFSNFQRGRYLDRLEGDLGEILKDVFEEMVDNPKMVTSDHMVNVYDGNTLALKVYLGSVNAKYFTSIKEEDVIDENMSDKEEIALSKLKGSDQLKIKAVIDMIKKEKKSK